MDFRNDINIESKINEAEVCRNMGLHQDAVKIYERVITELPPHESQRRAQLQKQITLLQKEIDSRERVDPGSITDGDIDILIDQLPDPDDPASIFDKASAFKEMGLNEQAISDLFMLIGKDYPDQIIVSELAENMLKLHPPLKAVEEFNRLMGAQDLDNPKKARVTFLFGREMEQKDHREEAFEIYKAARQLDATDAEIQKALDSIATTFKRGSKYDYLLREKLVTADQLQKAFTLSRKMKKSVETVLIDHFQISKQAIGKSFSLFYDCPFREYDPAFTVPVELLSRLKKTFLLNEYWVPLSWEKNRVEILVDDPRNLNKTDNIKSLMGTGNIIFSVAIREDIHEFIKRFFDENRNTSTDSAEASVDNFDFPDVTFEEEEEEAETEEIDEASGQVVKLVDQFIIAAYRKKASDIHIEPSPVSRTTTIRFRLDGICQEYMKVPNSMVRGIISRIKIMARLNIAERRLPQDGKIKFKRKGVPPFELRVATFPVAGGFEDVVLRILASAGAMKIDDMGLTDRNLDVMKRIIAKPYGLVLAVGPTGSGKTTSLHAILGHINTPGIKIWTAEDPIEITQPGLRQTEVKPQIGLDFARLMRAFLRGDPDVIMIGEMRDKETASTGIEASLTGHLVFSTLHTNSAPETITRLLDIGLNPLNFSDAFLGVLAQRLTRRLCRSCREEYLLSENEFEMIRGDYGEAYFERTGIVYQPEMTLFRAGRCDECSNTGYRGRMGIHELMEGTPEIKLMIKNQTGTEALFEQALKDGMSTLKQDGILKVFKGETDMAEVRRVCIN